MHRYRYFLAAMFIIPGAYAASFFVHKAGLEGWWPWAVHAVVVGISCYIIGLAFIMWFKGSK